MKIKMLGKPYGRFIQVTFPERITFSSSCAHCDRDVPLDEELYTTGIFTLDELKSFVEVATGHIRDFEILRDDPSNVDTDPPDEYNKRAFYDYVFEDENGHDCKATVDGG